MDRLQAMQAFVEVVDTGSFTLAAQRLGVSKSQISKLLAGLETQLATQLLQRTTRNLNLTESGQRYLLQVRAILSLVSEAEEEAQNYGQDPQGRLRISAPVAFGARILGPILAEFAQLYSKIHLDINLTDRYIDLVQEGIDVSIRIGHMSDSSMKQKRLAYTQRHLVAAPGYLANAPRITHPADLRAHPCLIHTHSAAGRRWSFTGPGGEGQSIDVGGHFGANSGDLLVQAALQGLGIAKLPNFFIDAHLASGDLVQVLPDWREAPLPILAIYPDGRHLSQKARVFIDFLASKELA